MTSPSIYIHRVYTKYTTIQTIVFVTLLERELLSFATSPVVAFLVKIVFTVMDGADVKEM